MRILSLLVTLGWGRVRAFAGAVKECFGSNHVGQINVGSTLGLGNIFCHGAEEVLKGLGGFGQVVFGSVANSHIAGPSNSIGLGQCSTNEVYPNG